MDSGEIIIIQTKMDQDKDQEQQLNNQISIQQSQQSLSQTKETSVLSIQQNNQIDLHIQEIIALYQQIDNKIFDHQLPVSIVIAERNQFSNIQEVENQRIILQSNQNSTIIQAFQAHNHQLIVIKLFSIQSQEMLIKKMDEYIIHHKVNELYPEQSIQLILPVQIVKKKQFFQMVACIERADINLFDYSQNQKILQEEADIIFQQIIQQIIQLHKIKIAHRDIKPQNIFYIKFKGWLLSDFGESIEYSDVDNIYEIRGTQYFLKDEIKNQLKLRYCKQNLLQNDLYAIVVTIIMIQKQHYIKDIEQEIIKQKNRLYDQILQIDQINELIVFQQNLFFRKQNYQEIILNQYQRKLNQNEQNLNKKYGYTSWLDLFEYFNESKSHTFLVPQILELIQKNVQNIILYKQLKDHLFELQLFSNLKLSKIIPKEYRIDKFNVLQIDDQLFCIKNLFQCGYSETTIWYANEFLKNNYSQEVHMTLIDSYFRARMFDQAEQQFKKFIEGLLFDFLNSDIEYKFFQYLIYYSDTHNSLKIYLDFKIEDQLIQRKLIQVENEQFINQLEQQYEQNKDNIFQNQDQILNNLLQTFASNEKFQVFKNDLQMLVIDFVIQWYPLDILLTLLSKINQISCSSFDINKKLTFCFEIAEIYIYLNKSKEFKQYFKPFQIYILQSESWQQIVIFKLFFLVIQIEKQLYSQLACQIELNCLIDHLMIELQKSTSITFQSYCISQDLLNICQYILLTVNYQKQWRNVLNFHIQNTQIVLMTSYFTIQKNQKRYQLMVFKYENLLKFEETKDYASQYENFINFCIKPSIRKILSVKIEEFSSQSVFLEASKEFLFQRYLI